MPIKTTKKTIKKNSQKTTAKKAAVKKQNVKTKSVKNLILHKEFKGGVEFQIDVNFYPMEVIYQTAYVFTRDTYVVLDGNFTKKIKVTLVWKDEQKQENENLVGNFMNELLNQTIRGMVNLRNRTAKEHIISRALVTASGNKEFDDILSDLSDIDEDVDQELDKISKELK